MELRVDRGTKVLLVLILLALVANVLKGIPPTPALALNDGETALVQNGLAGPFAVSLQTSAGGPLVVALAAGEGDRVYFYDGGSLFASKDAGKTWTKIR